MVALSKVEIRKHKPNKKLRKRHKLVNMAADVKWFRLRFKSGSLKDIEPQKISVTEHHYLEFSTLSEKENV